MILSNYFIKNNKTKIKPKKTELLNLFSTFMTQNEKPYQSKYTDIKNPWLNIYKEVLKRKYIKEKKNINGDDNIDKKMNIEIKTEESAAKYF